MDILPSLFRVAVAVVGFVAVLIVHESLMTNNRELQVALSGGENLEATAAGFESGSVIVADARDIEVDPVPEVSGYDTGTTQPTADEVIDAGMNSISASSGELQSTIEGGQAHLEQGRAPGTEDDTVPPASSAVVAVSVSPSIQWSAVWRPFFSPTTAQGFADYVSESTGLVLRVQPSEVPGHYLVEVQHGTEAERIDADRRIVEFTGFKPPGALQ